MARAHQTPIPRRVVLLGAAGTALLAACSSDSTNDNTSDTGPTTSSDATTPADGARSLVAMFNAGGPFLVSGQSQRAPFTIGDGQGLPNPDAVPDEIELWLARSEDDAEVLPKTTVPVHRDGVPIPYYPYVFEVDEPGTYIARATVDGQEVSAAISVAAAGDATYPLVGTTLPSTATPTTTDALGVDPICTREPPCALHATSLDQILTAGRPVAVLVATPKFCQTAMCGPTLDLLIDVAADHPDLDVVHIEVYRTAEEAEAGHPVAAPAVDALGLDFEPVLFVVDASGAVVSVLASIMDRGELDEALSLIGSG